MEEKKPENLSEGILELIRRVSTTLPGDVRESIKKAVENEKKGSPAQTTLQLLLKNSEAAEKNDTPICQDTGSLNFYVSYDPRSHTQKTLKLAIINATQKATQKAYLRPNAVEPISGKNSGDNIGEGAPHIHFTESDEEDLEVKLLLKGGGSENVSAQYKLPDSKLGAGRDLEGVRKCVLDAVYHAQGLGCAPGIVGVGVGGTDRVSSMMAAKEQLFRELNDENPDPKLNRLEKKLLDELNSLGIGPMGFGGNTTVLGVKVGARHRHPASFFVSIAYLCWAARRGTMKVDSQGEVSYDST
ncbi:MAG: fumarate hydratase [Candidatus Altiarchaeota archaeon]